MKIIITIFIITILSVWYCNKDKAQSTYNKDGVRYAVAECSEKRDCLVEIGKVCGESGYTVDKQESDEDNTVIEARCQKTKKE